MSRLLAIALASSLLLISGCSGDSEGSSKEDTGSATSDNGTPLGDTNGATGDTAGGDTATAPATCPELGARGPLKAGIRSLMLDDPQRDGKLDTRVIYPATEDGTDTAPDTAGAPYPLIVLSHAFLMDPATYDHLTTHLASHGFVTIATRHQDSAPLVVERLKKACEEIPPAQQLSRLAEAIPRLFEPDHALRRPKDLTTLLDAALAMNEQEGFLKGMVDPGRIGAVGHSFGGYSVMVASGAVLDTETISKLCVEGPKLSDLSGGSSLKFLICSLFSTTAPEAMKGDLDLGDPRISAVVNIAAPAEIIWGKGFEGLAAVAPPKLFIYTTTDEQVIYESGPVAAFPVLTPPKAFFTLEGGNHGNFGTIDFEAATDLAGSLPADCAYKAIVKLMMGDPDDQPALSLEDQQRLTRAAVGAFMQLHVAGTEDCEQKLASETFDVYAGSFGHIEHSEEVSEPVVDTPDATDTPDVPGGTDTTDTGESTDVGSDPGPA